MPEPPPPPPLTRTRATRRRVKNIIGDGSDSNLETDTREENTRTGNIIRRVII